MNQLRHYALVVIFGCTAHLAISQTQPHGHVEGNTYIDERFGLRYTFPIELDVQSSLMNGMPVGTGAKQGVSEFLFSAMAKPDGHIRSGVFIVSDPFPLQPMGINESAQYLKLMVASSMGYKKPFDISTVKLAGGQIFSKSEVGIDGPVHIYGAQLATVCGSRFIAFMFSASSQERIDALLHILDTLQLACPHDHEIIIAAPTHHP